MCPHRISLISLNFDLAQEHCDKTELNPPVPCDIEPVRANTDTSPLSTHIFKDNCEDILSDLNIIIDKFAASRVYFRVMTSCVLKKILLTLAVTTFYQKAEAKALSTR